MYRFKANIQVQCVQNKSLEIFCCETCCFQNRFCKNDGRGGPPAELNLRGAASAWRELKEVRWVAGYGRRSLVLPGKRPLYVEKDWFLAVLSCYLTQLVAHWGEDFPEPLGR